MVPCFHQSYSWVEEVGNDNGATWLYFKGRKGFLEKVTSQGGTEGNGGGGEEAGEESMQAQAVENETEMDKQEPYRTHSQV